MSNDNTIVYVIGGLGLLYLMMKSAPAAIAQQNAALQSAAQLQSQNINTQANLAYAQTGANLANQLVTDFSS